MYVQVENEILEEREIVTANQIAKIRTRHCWAETLEITGPDTAAVGQVITLTISLKTWEGKPLAADREIPIRADGSEIIVSLVAGVGEFNFQRDQVGEVIIETCAGNKNNASKVVAIYAQ